MKISYNWLQECFEKELPNPKDLADLLNIRAFEVEEVEEKDGDSIFEIKVTPDRAPDCLSHLGIAREVALHTGQSLIQKQIPQIEKQFDTTYTINIEEKSCVRYMSREIRNVVVKESPLELKKKLEAIGQRSINTIVDITNLVMLEIGQPMHAFDTSKIAGTQITIGAPKDVHITTLDNKEFELTPLDITVQDKEGNLAIAGVKGGKKAEVTMSTTNILLESANFFSAQVRKTSKTTSIQNDSSKRFENGLTPIGTAGALNLASHYVQKYASSDATQFSNVIDVYPRPQTRPYIVGLHVSNVTQKLGIQIKEEEIVNLVPNIGYKKILSVKEIEPLIESVLGAKYLLGASVLFDAPQTVDCSSLMSYLYSQIGVEIPRTSIDQFVFSKKITLEELTFGDLVFNNSKEGDIHSETKEFLPGTKVEFGVDHVGMYLGEGRVLHASRYQENGTVIENLNESAQFTNIVGYGRVVGAQDFPRYTFDIPYERLDLQKEINLIEEIGRTYGYEKITPVAPVLNISPIGVSTYDKINTIKSHLTELGFDEVVTYTFQKKGDISVIKPLANDKGYLRTGLVKGLTDALELNFKNKELFAIEVIKVFEIGNVFTDAGEKLMFGLAVRSSNKKLKVKQLIQETLDMLSQKLDTSFDVTLTDQQEVIEIELSPILESVTNVHHSISKLETKPYVPFSLYPYITRDVAVWASNTKTKDDIEKIITEHATDLLFRYDLFDEFSKDNRTSYAYRLVFQSFEKTLTDDEVNLIMDKVYSLLQADSDFEIR
jgi:phenylalanyl-tRNA synthetase beta subunit